MNRKNKAIKKFLEAAINWSYELGFSENKNDVDFIKDWKD